jgi:nitrogen regulatory protein PII
MKTNSYELIFVIVNRGFSVEVMDAAMEKGAQGGTILHARGTNKVAETVYGVKIEPEKEIVLMIVDKEKCADIMQSIHEKIGLNTPGSGICFAMPVDDAVGLKVY